MIELLTVIAIIAVLATLLSATLSTAQRKARKTACVGNLRQIALAVDMYIDDHRKRPDSFRSLVSGKYLTDRVLLCPEDKRISDAGWAGILEQLWGGAFSLAPGAERGQQPLADLPHSYFKSFDNSDEEWQRVQRSPYGGIAACQLHGIGRQDKDRMPSIDAYQGLVLRALKDGSVISRQVFWSETTSVNSLAPGVPFAPTVQNPDLPLFIDQVD